MPGGRAERVLEESVEVGCRAGRACAAVSSWPAWAVRVGESVAAGCLSAQSTSVGVQDVLHSAQQPHCGGRSGARGTVSCLCLVTPGLVCAPSAGGGAVFPIPYSSFQPWLFFSPLPKDLLHFGIEIAEVVDGNCWT